MIRIIVENDSDVLNLSKTKSEITVSCLSDPGDINVRVTVEDPLKDVRYIKFFKNKNDAVTLYKNVLKSINDLVDASDIAKKFNFTHFVGTAEYDNPNKVYPIE